MKWSEYDYIPASTPDGQGSGAAGFYPEEEEAGDIRAPLGHYIRGFI